MFERYTERARRVIFFARYEASQFGSMTIETEHLLLGLVREDRNLAHRFMSVGSSTESIRQEIEARIPIHDKVPTSVDLPLSSECHRILAYAAEEADRLNHRHIGTEHLLLGILREENSVAAQVLQHRGLGVEAIREELARSLAARDAAVREAPAPPIEGDIPYVLDRPMLPKDGVVTDADTARRIAEAIWAPLYGADTVTAQKPLTVERRSNIWIVTGTSGPETALFAFIFLVDGRILSVGRGEAGRQPPT